MLKNMPSCYDLILFVVLFLPLFSEAQIKPFYSVIAGLENNNKLGVGFHGNVAGGVKIKDLVYVGAGAGITKFTDADRPFVPVFGKIGIIEKNTGLMFFIEPGAIVNKVYEGYEVRNGERYYGYKPGFYYNISAGLKVNKKSNVSPVFMLGYSSYDFLNRLTPVVYYVRPEKYGAFSGRVGIMF